MDLTPESSSKNGDCHTKGEEMRMKVFSDPEFWFEFAITVIRLKERNRTRKD